MNIKPLGDRLVVKVIKTEEKTPSGIVVPDTAKEKPQQGEVVAVGPGRVLENGERVPVEVNEGDTVVYSKYAGTEFKQNNEEILILNERDILAKLEQ